MSRIRTIKPEFFLDEDVASLEPLDRLAFIGLWCVADKAGRLEDRPARLAVQILPYERAGFEERLDRLASSRFIVRYALEDGRKIIQIRTWKRHQRPHHTEAESILPGPGVNGEPTVNEPSTHGEETNGELFEHGASTDGREGKGRERGVQGGIPESLAESKTPAKGGAKASPRKKGNGKVDLTDGFPEFWAAYPRRVAKAAAERAWAKLSPDSKLAALSGAKLWGEVWADAPDDRRQFIPYPATWLNGQRWTDPRPSVEHSAGFRPQVSDRISVADWGKGVHPPAPPPQEEPPW